MAIMRLQKYLALCGIASRRASEDVILEGRVRINGTVVTELGVKVDTSKDLVKVGNRVLSYTEARGILLVHKPRGVVSTMSDPEGRRAISEFLTGKNKHYFPVGRLDYDTSGLVIMTDDGELAERLAHPRYEAQRIYEARLTGHILPATIAKIEKGVRLEDGWAKAEVRMLKRNDQSSWVEVKVLEGRNRLVRRLFESVGHPVERLVRIQFGPFFLGKLPVGDTRQLSSVEYQEMRDKVFSLRRTIAKAKRTGAKVVSGAQKITTPTSRTKVATKRGDEERPDFNPRRKPRRSKKATAAFEHRVSAKAKGMRRGKGKTGGQRRRSVR